VNYGTGLTVSLSPGEAAHGREFTQASRSAEDLAALERIRASLTQRIRSGLAGGEWSAVDEAHWLVVPEVRALVQSRPAYAIGFFGQAREVDHTPILEFEHELLARATAFPGLLAYYNVRFANRQWGNLVLFASEDDPASVRSDPTHQAALARAAHHYRSVRLHRIRLPGGALDAAPPRLESTLLIDFGETPPWRAVRAGAL
jgi:hypothetical protein